MIFMLFTGSIYVGLLLWYVYWWHRKPSHHSAGAPSVSVVIPARNEAGNVAALLQDLRQQEYGGKLEVIVVDDHSTDGTAAIAAPLADQAIKAAEVGIPASHPSPKKAALSAGIEVATGDWVITLDADVRIGKKHIATLMQWADVDTVCIAGPVAFGRGLGLLHHFQQLDMLGMQLFTGAAIHWGKPFLCNGANFAFRRQAFLEVDGYQGINDIASGDDVLLLRKMAHVFGPKAIAYAADPKAVAVTSAQTQWNELVQQRIRWASKVARIRLAPAIWLGIVAVLFHALLVSQWIAALLEGHIAGWLLAATLVKWVVEAIAVGVVARHLEQPVKWVWLLPAQILYLVYVPAAAILGNFTRYQWKGRRLK